MDGILNLNKPTGLTSHNVVDRVRTLSRIRRVGHAGTLDPMATGVLLVCVGRATRVSEYLMAGRKVYRAEIRLGVTTDTYDREGQVVTESPVTATRSQVERALAQFQGTIEQIPPMYSAIKHRGVPLHRLARRGIEVERKPRQVEIFRLELTGWDPPYCTMEVTCSSGTYIRSLAHDLGGALGCGAHLTALVRLASGAFWLEEATPLEELTADTWQSFLLPIDAALANFPALHLDARTAQRLCAGQAISAPAPLTDIAQEQESKKGRLARVYDLVGHFLALAEYDPSTGLWRPRKVFFSPDSFQDNPCPLPAN